MSTAEAAVRQTMADSMTPEEKARADAIMHGWLAFNAKAKEIEDKFAEHSEEIAAEVDQAAEEIGKVELGGAGGLVLKGEAKLELLGGSGVGVGIGDLAAEGLDAEEAEVERATDQVRGLCVEAGLGGDGDVV